MHHVHHPHANHPAVRKYVEERMARASGVATSSRSDLRSRLDDMEARLQYVTAFSRGLLEVLLRHQLTTPEELVALMKELDELDGVAGDGLAPDALAAELGSPPPRLDEAEKMRRALATIGKKDRARRRRKS